MSFRLDVLNAERRNLNIAINLAEARDGEVMTLYDLAKDEMKRRGLIKE